MEQLNVYEADIYFIKKVHLLSFLKRINLHTSLDVISAKHIVNKQKSNPFISFYTKGYSANDYVAKKIFVKKLKR